ncbi:synaptotagmin-1-like [Empidonax traillii]|uniref:synaptotagmin-1-like n=1 Tax=Empidonax traillii TaxID=164674 RepID=UPI000FFD35A7|nr:synaptotagmin-1-like [Empidonax traillii]
MPEAVHLQVFLSAGLSLLCLSILLGCTMCWWHRRRPSPREWAALELGPALPAMTVPVPIQQQYEEMAGEVLDNQLAGVWQRRCTISRATLLLNKESPLVHPTAGFPLPSEQRPQLHCHLSYSAPEAILTVTVLGVSHLPEGLRDEQGSYIKVYLVPRLPACQRMAVCRRSLRPATLEPCRFGPHSPEELSSFTLRFAIYARLRSLRDSFVGEVLFPCAQVSWDPQASCSYTWELASTKTKRRKVRMAAVSSRGLSSCFAHSTSCSVLSSSPKSLGQLFLLLQYQALASRIKVLVRKAADLGRLSRMPGTPGHYIIIHLYHDGCVIDTKETKSTSGYNPVWNEPFLFNIPAGDIQQQELALEFIVMQVRWMERSHFLMPKGGCWGGITLFGMVEGHQPRPTSPLLPQARLHARGSALGCVQVGPRAPGTGLLHWRDMCSRGPQESAQWHQIQPNTPRP